MERPCPKTSNRCSCAARAVGRSRFAMTRGAVFTRFPGCLKASFPIWNAATAETDSSWSREEMERFQNSRPCGACGGYRLKPEALAVKIGGLHAGQVVQMSISEAHDWISAAPGHLTNRERNRQGDPEGNPGTAGFSGQCRAELPDAQPQCRHTVGRRIPAHSACQPDRLGPDRSAMCWMNPQSVCISVTMTAC